MMYNDEREHPDEGTIHAWLDGATSAEESSRLEAHVASCPACEANVAEARGLIAGASRIVMQLDDAPKATVRPLMRSDLPKSSLWRSLRVTPARASIAAVLLVAVGAVLTSRRPPSPAIRDTVSVLTPADKAVQPAAVQSEPREKANVTERLIEEQPARTIAPAKVAGVVVPPAETLATAKRAMADSTASSQVAQARMTIAATRDSLAGRAADKTAVGAAAPVANSAPVPVATLEGARAAESRLRMSTARATRVEPACYRVAAIGEGSGSWGDARLPFIVALDSAGDVARVLTAKGEDTQSRAIVMRFDADSLSFRLRRIGFSGSLALGGTGPTKRGFAQSQKAEDGAQSITVTAISVSCPLR